jgi:hypothetical protein
VAIVNGGGAIVMKKLCCGDAPVESVTVIKNGNVPAVIGVPEIVPLLGVRANPGGNAPLVTAHVGVPDSGTAVSIARYETFTWPEGNAEATIVGIARTGVATKNRPDTINATVSSKRNKKRLVKREDDFFCKLAINFIA